MPFSTGATDQIPLWIDHAVLEPEAAVEHVGGLRHSRADPKNAPIHAPARTLVNSIRCNDEVAVQFANRYGASEAFSYLYRLTSKEQREQVPITSVEELAEESRSDQEPDVVPVDVKGR